jgi:hypothetical protein
VPFNFTSSILRVVVTQDLGDNGVVECDPVEFPWRFYYAVPTWPIWAIILLLLILPKANRKPQAWLIFIPVIGIMLAWRMLAQLFGLPDVAMTESGSILFTWILANGVIWLCGFAFSESSRIINFILIVIVTAVVALASIYGHDYSDSRDYMPMAIYSLLFVLSQTTAIMIASWLCRKKYSAKKFMALLFLAMLVCTLLIGIFLVIVTMLASGGGKHIPFIIVTASIMMLVEALILYIINLPFMLLVFNNSFYRERFKRMYKIQTQVEPLVDAQPVDAIVNDKNN